MPLALKIPVAVLGAGGLVGHKFVELAARHPWLEIVALTGSEKSVGKPYREVAWCGESCVPEELSSTLVEETSVEKLKRRGISIAFSALPPDDAERIEPELARAGIYVVSNASPMRLDPDVPLLNPEVNADHVELLEEQHRRRGWGGGILKVPNCTTAILTLALKPLLDEFGLKRVIVSTMQSVSGAGLRGVPSMSIIDNIVPFIEGEEEKIEREAPKVLGVLRGSEVSPASVRVSASCNRVPVLEGHLENVFVELSRSASPEEVIEALESFSANKIRGLGLPSAPSRPIVVRREVDRPQPRLDRSEGSGMSVVVGRLRLDRALENGFKMVVLGNNLVRGAAGTGLLIAELLIKLGLVV
ncbi:MAG: aspartate-semialdehyde dehydrogenase [Fervidicoccaceae archaeon]